LTLLSKCSTWRLSKKRGLVADVWTSCLRLTSTGNSNRSMCDDASCDFLAKMPPKRRFWNTKQRVGSVFSNDFAIVRSPNRVLTPSQIPSNRPARPAVSFSKIFVWVHTDVQTDIAHRLVIHVGNKVSEK